MTMERQAPKVHDWDVKVKIWELQSRKQPIASIVRHFQLNAGKEGYPDYPPDRSTIQKVCRELLTLSPELTCTLPPEVTSYVLEQRPDLKGKLESPKQPLNWIENHITNNGQPPPAEEWMIKLLHNYSPNQPLEKTTEWIYPSTQLWYKVLLPSQREKWLQFIEWQGGNREDFLEEMRRRAPPGGESRELKRKR